MLPRNPILIKPYQINKSVDDSSQVSPGRALDHILTFENFILHALPVVTKESACLPAPYMAHTLRAIATPCIFSSSICGCYYISEDTFAVIACLVPVFSIAITDLALIRGLLLYECQKCYINA